MKIYFRLLCLQLPWLFLLILHTGCSKYNEPAPYFPVTPIRYEIKNGEAVVASLGTSEEVSVPAQVEIDGMTYPVTTIGENACNNKIKTLYLPSSIKKMEWDAFASNQIENLYIEDLTSWCAIEFSGSTSLTSNPDNVWYKSNPITQTAKVFFGGEEVKGKLAIPEGVTEISRYAFANLNLREIDFGPTLKKIGNLAFYNNMFETLAITSPIETVAAQAFYKSPVAEVTLSSSVKKIGQGAFNEVRRINIESLDSWIDIDFYDTSIYIDYTYGSLPMFAAEYDLALDGEVIRNLVIPEGTTQINKWTFSYCSIWNVSFPNTLKKIADTAFYNCDKLEKLVIPGSVESVIGFNELENLKTVILEEGVKKLDEAFGNSRNLKSITLPSTIVYCDLSSVLYYHTLESMFVYAVVPPDVKLLSNYTPSDSENLKVYVPEKSIDAYKRAEGWKDLKNILPIPEAVVNE